LKEEAQSIRKNDRSGLYQKGHQKGHQPIGQMRSLAVTSVRSRGFLKAKNWLVEGQENPRKHDKRTKKASSDHYWL
jgi:hypothetical protein